GKLAGGVDEVAVEDEEAPAAPVEAAVARAESESLQRILLAEARFAAGAAAPPLIAPPEVMIAEAVLHRESAVRADHAIPEVPEQAGARLIRRDGVHDRVAAVQDQGRGVRQSADLLQAGGQPFGGAPLRLEVYVGQVRDAQRPLRRYRRLFG